MLWIRVQLDFCSVIIGVCYRPPHTDQTDFNDSLHNCLGDLMINFPNHYMVLGGDFNYPGIDWATLKPISNCNNPS